MAYVGETAFRRLSAYAEANGLVPVEPKPIPDPPVVEELDTPMVYGIHEGSYAALGLLRVANTATLAVLDVDVDLDARAAKSVYYGRQATPFASLEALDAAPYVGESTFQHLLAYAVANQMVPSCGDGAVQPVEEACDGTPGCTAVCELAYTCGDGTVEVGEKCDDGNVAAGDGCSAECRWEILRMGPAQTGQAQAMNVGTHRWVAGHFTARSGSQYWRLEIDRPSVVSIDIMGNNVLAPISLAEIEVGAVARNAPGQGEGWAFGELNVPDPYRANIPFWRWYWDPACSSSGCSRPDYDSIKKYQVLRNHPTASGYDQTFQIEPGVYFISFHTGAGNENYSPTLSYVVEIDVRGVGPVCGDRLVGEGEECDDGARVDGDGCSRRCAWEVLAEREPNNARASAQPVNAFRVISGGIGVGDEDWFGATVGADGRFLAHFDGCPFDGVFELYDNTGRRVARDDDGAGNYCPALSVSRLVPGAYFLRVMHANAAINGGAYVLNLF